MTLLEKQSKFLRYNMKCRGKHDTTWNIPRSFPHYISCYSIYCGKSIIWASVLPFILQKCSRRNQLWRVISHVSLSSGKNGPVGMNMDEWSVTCPDHPVGMSTKKSTWRSDLSRVLIILQECSRRNHHGGVISHVSLSSCRNVPEGIILDEWSVTCPDHPAGIYQKKSTWRSDQSHVLIILQERSF